LLLLRRPLLIKGNVPRVRVNRWSAHLMVWPDGNQREARAFGETAGLLPPIPQVGITSANLFLPTSGAFPKSGSVKPTGAFVIARSDSDEAISCISEPGRLLRCARNDERQTLGKPCADKNKKGNLHSHVYVV
jgi:hypothetical protein